MSHAPTQTAGTVIFDTAIGPCGLGWNDRGIDCVQLPDVDETATAARMTEKVAGRPRFDLGTRRLPSDVRNAARRMQRHFDGKLDDLRDVPIDVSGATPFARKVYAALRRVGPGELVSYGELAKAAGSPGAARAIGRAMATNPVPMIVPCHRVVSSAHRLGGFSAPGGQRTKVRMLFIEGVILDEAQAAGLAHLRAADPVLAALIERIGPYVPAADRDVPPYDALARSLVGQQLSTKAAATIAARVCALSPGDGFPTPAELEGIDDAALRAAGLSRAKASYLRSLADHMQDGSLDFRRMRTASDDDVIETITQVRGFGRWSAQMFLQFYLGRLDVLPTDDLGFRRGMMLAYGLRAMPDEKRCEKIAACWSPYRSIGTWYMWQILELPEDRRPKRRRRA